MRKVAVVLMGLGVAVGGVMALWLLAGGPPAWGLDWVLWVGTVKLGLASALGLIGSGAIVRRLAIRREQRAAAGMERLDSR